MTQLSFRFDTINSVKARLQEALDKNEFTLEVAADLEHLLNAHDEQAEKIRSLTDDLVHTTDLVDFQHPPSRL